MPYPTITPLSLKELSAPAPTVAEQLIGTLLLRILPEQGGETSALLGRVVEAEAYTEDDPASHSYTGRTERSKVMFGSPGHAYVYLIYGMHSCLNVVCGPEGSGEAVLIRALEPLYGFDVMVRNRGLHRSLNKKSEESRERLIRELNRKPATVANGPGKVGAALGVTVARDYGKPLLGESDLILAQRIGLGARCFTARRGTVLRSPRIGIRKNADAPRRFFESGNPAVSA